MSRLLSSLLIIVCIFHNTACVSSHSKMKKYPSYALESSGQLIKQIEFTGFVLKDKKGLEDIVKPYKNTHVSQKDVDQILTRVKSFYLESGFAGLVSLSSKVKKTKLTIEITLDK